MIWRSVAAGNSNFVGIYLDSIREIERRIQKSEERAATGAPIPSIDQPPGVPPTFEEHIELMFDLMTIAFQADITRVITLMIGREGGNRTYRSIGVPDAHHGLSHHFNDPAKIERLQKIDQHHVEMFSHFLAKLKQTKDGDGTLLDNSMVLYGSSMGDANIHDNTNLPIILAGGGFKHGQHLAFDKDNNYPLPNLFVSMLQRLGIESDKFAGATGTMRGLETK